MNTIAPGARTVVDLRVRGTVDLRHYAEHVETRVAAGTGFRARGRVRGEATGTARPRLRTAFRVEHGWDYVEATVRQRAPDLLTVDVTGPERAVRPAVEQLRRVLSCDGDGAGFAEVARADPVLSETVAGRDGLRPVLFHTPFEAACWAVVCPGLRIGQTAALMRGLAETHGHVVGTPEGPLWVFPPPHALIGSALPSGLSALKRQRLDLVARTALEGGLDAASLRALPVDEAVGALRRIPGIGPFSAEFVLGRGAGHPDLFPVRERPLRRAMADLYEVDDVDDALTEIAGRWRPHRSWGAFFLRHVHVGCRRCVQ